MAKGRAGWFSRLLAPSRLRWAGALAAALVAAVVGLRVLEFPLADAPLPASGTRSNEEEREFAITRQDAPAQPAREEEVMEEEPAEASADSLTLVRRQAPEGAAEPAKDVARQEVAELKDESFEQAARKRVAGEPAPPAAPEVAREAFATGALSATGKAGQKKQDDAKETAHRRVIGGRLEQDVDELKPIQLNEGNRDKARARSSTPDEPASVANVVGPEAQEVPEAKPAAAVPPADRDPTAQPISVSRTLRVQPALEATRAEQGYRVLVARYPIRDEPMGSTDLAKEKEGEFSDVDLTAECADWRQFLLRYPGNERQADVSYRLALCSIEVFERSPSKDNRQRALDDSKSYLDVATDDKRAEAIRRALVRIRP